MFTPDIQHFSSFHKKEPNLTKVLYEQWKEIRTFLFQDCNLSGPEVCRTEYIRQTKQKYLILRIHTFSFTTTSPFFHLSECWTKNDPHLVEDDVARCQTVQEEKCVEVKWDF